VRLKLRDLRVILEQAFDWTGLGCDVCGFGTVEDVDKFSPYKPCPECGEVMIEGSTPPTRAMFNYINNPMSPETNDREELGFLADNPADVDPADKDELPDHLKEPAVDFEDCYGPVPPTAEEPYAQQDPFVRDASPLPSPRR
jgi:hypothetical protein